MEYDNAIRRLLEPERYAAFEKEHNRLSVEYYGVQHMSSRISAKAQSFPKRSGDYMKDRGKKACFRRNKEYGCARAEDENAAANNPIIE